MVKTPPANAGEMDLIPNQGRSHMPWSNQARPPQLLSLRIKAWELKELKLRCCQLLKPGGALAHALHHNSEKSLRNEKPAQRKARATKSPRKEKPAQRKARATKSPLNEKPAQRKARATKSPLNEKPAQRKACATKSPLNEKSAQRKVRTTKSPLNEKPAQ